LEVKEMKRMFGKKQNGFEPKKQKEPLSSRAGRNPVLWFILTFLKSWNPDAYSKLGSRPIREALRYFLVLLAVTLLIGMGVSISRILSQSGPVEGFLSQFSTLSINAVAERPADFNFGVKFRLTSTALSQNQTISGVNGLNASNSSNTSEKSSDVMKGADIILSPDGLYTKRSICMLWSPLCTFYREPVRIGGDGFFEVSKYRADYSKIFKTAILLMMPSAFIILFVAFCIKLLAIAVISSVLAYISFKLMRHNLSFRSVLSSSVYALTPLLVLSVFNTFTGILNGWLAALPYLLFGVLLITGLLMKEEEVF